MKITLSILIILSTIGCIGLVATRGRQDLYTQLFAVLTLTALMTLTLSIVLSVL